MVVIDLILTTVAMAKPAGENGALLPFEATSTGGQLENLQYKVWHKWISVLKLLK